MNVPCHYHYHTIGHYDTSFIAYNVMLIANGQTTTSVKRELLGGFGYHSCYSPLSEFLFQWVLISAVNLSSSSQASVV